MTVTTDDIAVRVERLTREFPGILAVDDVSLSFERGQVHAVIGPNGSGKSTLLNLIAGTLAPTAGRIFAGDREVTAAPVDTVARHGVVKLNQQTAVFDHLTALENVAVSLQIADEGTAPLAAQSLSEETRSAAETILDRMRLGDHASTPAHDLSYGQQKLLELALVMAVDPDVVLLDEPTAGLSETSADRMLGLVERLAADVTVLLVEHDLGAVERLADNVVSMEEGSVVAAGAFEDVRRSSPITDRDTVTQTHV